MHHPCFSDHDICIAGAGIIGLSLALELHHRGASVTVLDRATPLGEASTAAAGMLAASDPHNLPELRSFADLSLSLYPAFLDRLHLPPAIHLPFHPPTTLQALPPASLPQSTPRTPPSRPCPPPPHADPREPSFHPPPRAQPRPPPTRLRTSRRHTYHHRPSSQHTGPLHSLRQQRRRDPNTHQPPSRKTVCGLHRSLGLHHLPPSQPPGHPEKGTDARSLPAILASPSLRRPHPRHLYSSSHLRPQRRPRRHRSNDRRRRLRQDAP